MRNRRKNNIIIGTLCAVLVLMGVGYAILSTTLNIGGTANIKGDFDIHFTRIQRSSSTITDSTLLSTMDNGTGITDGTNNHEGTFTAVLQKPTDYVIYDVVVANTGSIDGYLTFTFGDKHNNFNYYKDFYSVEFIRDDVTPEIKADILQPNATFTDTEVLENTTGTRTYKIKVTFKESATSFPDTTTNGDFECSLNLTYSQQAPSGGNNEGNTESNLTWYAGEYDGMSFAVAFEQVGRNKVLKHQIMNGTDYIQQAGEQIFEPYNPVTMSNLETHIGVPLQEGDYVQIIDGVFYGAIHDKTVYSEIPEGNDYIINSYPLDPNGSLEKYLNSGNEEQETLTWYATQDGSLAIALSDNSVEDKKNLEYLIYGGSDITNYATFSHSLIPYDSSIVLAKNYIDDIQVGDYILIDETNDGNVLYGILRNNTILFQISPNGDADTFTLNLMPNASLEDYVN